MGNLSDYAIYTKGLTKNFRSYKKFSGFKGSFKAIFNREYINKAAVNDFDLEIKKGKIIGLLGPNGAGKTTLMKMFTGIVVPSNGELTVLGKRPWERDKLLRKNIALVMGFMKLFKIDRVEVHDVVLSDGLIYQELINSAQLR